MANTKSIVFSHPTGNANVRECIQGLSDYDLLSAFHTSIACFPGTGLDKIAGFGPLSEIRRRSFSPEIQQLTQTHPFKELCRLIAMKTVFGSLTKHETGLFSIDAVYQEIDRQVAGTLPDAVRAGARAVYAYEDASLSSFRAAGQLGMTKFYDLPIGYWRTARELLKDELNKRPEWKPTLTGFGDSDAKVARKDEELQLASHIFVASSFTANSLENYRGKLGDIHVIPYGFPPVGEIKQHEVDLRKGPLRLLFVGGLSQRKGIADLFDAIKPFGKDVMLTVVGSKIGETCQILEENLKQHTYIPSLPHAEILKIMREHDVLVFPSLFEGFGLVITEAMSQGTPVITTDRTAGPDLIVDGVNGWLVKASAARELEQRIASLLNQPDEIVKAGLSAQETARKRPWQQYGFEMAGKIGDLLTNES